MAEMSASIREALYDSERASLKHTLDSTWLRVLCPFCGAKKMGWLLGLEVVEVVVMPVSDAGASVCGLMKVTQRRPVPGWYCSFASECSVPVSGSVGWAEEAVRMREHRESWLGSQTLLLGSLLDGRTSG